MSDVYHNTGMNRLRHCEQQYYFAEVVGLETQSSVNMLLGSWFHALMQAQGIRQGVVQQSLLSDHKVVDLGFDAIDPVPLDDLGDPTSGDFVADVHRYLLNNVAAYFPTGLDEELDELPGRAWFLYNRYVARWFPLMQSETVLLVEHEWQRDTNGVTYGGKVDRVLINADGLLVVRDYKSTGSVPTSNFRLINSQLHLYAWGLAPLLAEYGLGDIMLVEYDYAYTYPPKVRLTKAGRLYKNQPALDTYALAALLKHEGADPESPHFAEHFQRAEEEGNERFFRRSSLPVNEHVVRRLLDEQDILLERAEAMERGDRLPVINPGRHCDWCSFTGLCTATVYGNDTTLLEQEYRSSK